MNRISKTFQNKNKILSIYFTAGFPKLNDTIPILAELEKSGVDMVEIGMPFSDPLADGVIIQNSSAQALKNGMTIKNLFKQLEECRKKISIPIILMGYLNPILQFGVDDFCKKCAEVGVDGVILPDLPLNIYLKEYRLIFEKHNIKVIFLITPQTSAERIRMIDENSGGFIYMVSNHGVTGSEIQSSDFQNDYFERVSKMNLKNPLVVGFGIKDKESFDKAVKHTSGGIIGSAFIQHLKQNPIENICDFINEIKA